MHTTIPFTQSSAAVDKETVACPVPAKQSPAETFMSWINGADVREQAQKEQAGKGAEKKEVKKTFLDSVRDGKATLRIGGSNEGVKEVQEKIKRSMEVLKVSKEEFNPETFAVDGDFGPNTRAALIIIQSRTKLDDKGVQLLDDQKSYGKGLNADGVVGAQTMKVLDTLAREGMNQETKRQYDGWKAEYLEGGIGRSEPKVLSQDGTKIVIEDKGFLGTGVRKEYSEEVKAENNSFKKFGFDAKVVDDTVELTYKGVAK